MNIGLLFDSDGTVLDSIPVAYRGTCSVLSHFSKPPISLDEFHHALHRPFHLLYRDRGITADFEEIWKVFVRAVHGLEVAFYPDVLPVWQSLRTHQRDIKMGVISLQKEAVARPHYERADALRYLDGFVCGSNKKSEAIKTFCGTFNLLPRNVFYIGDIRGDMEDAFTAGVNPVAILRPHTIETLLKEAGAQFFIRTLRDLPRVPGLEHLRDVVGI